jgi:hypothetical protein
MSERSNLAKVINVLGKNPNMKAADIVKHVGVSKVYAYNLLSTARKKLRMEKMPRGGWRLKPRMQGTPRDEKAVELLEHMASPAVSKLAEQVREVESLIARHYPTEDVVNHPAHYKVGGVETIDFIEAKNLSYHLGNVVKYISRADHKGSRLENLKKAQWYLEREIANASK